MRPRPSGALFAPRGYGGHAGTTRKDTEAPFSADLEMPGNHLEIDPEADPEGGEGTITFFCFDGYGPTIPSPIRC